MSTVRANSLEMLDGRGKGAITFDNIQDMVDSTSVVVGQKVRTLGYYAPGDGGGNDYEIVASGTGTDDGGSYIDLPGSGLQAKGLFPTGVNVKQFGAFADGSSDDLPAITKAKDYLDSAGGGVLHLPSGSLLIDGALNVNDPVNPIHILGAGVDATIITQPDLANGTLLSIANANGGSVSNLTLDGNASDLGGHGLRGDGLENYYIFDLKIINAPSYGMGFQGNGSFKNLFISRVVIDTCGSDGIDFKNRAFGNRDIHLSDVSVRNFGVYDTGSKAGIDIRGIANLTGISVTSFGGNGGIYDGIRFRPGEESDGNVGGHRSTLTGFYIDPEGSIVSGVNGIAIEARRVKVSSGVVFNAATGYNIRQEGCSLSAVSAENCDTGISLSDSGFATPGQRSSLSSIDIRNITNDAISVGTRENSFSSITIRGADRGIVIESGVSADQNSFVSGSVTNCPGGLLVDGGAATRVVAVSGITDQ